MNTKSLIVLPCRLGSTRLSQKHLIELSNGKTIFQMAYENCVKSEADKVLIATDHKDIYKRAKRFTSDIVMTSDEHQTGSDRVAEVAEKFRDYDFVLNVQGDEPLINPLIINSLIKSIVDSNVETVMSTITTTFKSIEELKAPENVKVVSDLNDFALYFSRNVIPFNNNHSGDINIASYQKHVGIYGYKRDFLLKYVQMRQTFLEKIENLEQLRVIENGFKIKLIKSDYNSIGIDTQEDLDRLELLLSNK